MNVLTIRINAIVVATKTVAAGRTGSRRRSSEPVRRIEHYYTFVRSRVVESGKRAYHTPATAIASPPSSPPPLAPHHLADKSYQDHPCASCHRRPTVEQLAAVHKAIATIRPHNRRLPLFASSTLAID